jgi:hypothetical protein
MKEITKVITKRYDPEGKLIEHTEVTTEKEIVENKYYYTPSSPIYWITSDSKNYDNLKITY